MVANGFLYVSSFTGLYAAHLANGQIAWHTLFPGSTTQTAVTAPYLVGQVLYVGVANVNEGGSTVSFVLAVLASNGSLHWQSASVPGQLFDITVADDTVYFGTIRNSPNGSFSGTLYSYTAREGKLLWQRDVAGGIQWRPVVAGGLVYVSIYPSESAPSSVLAFRAIDGKQQWVAQVGTSLAIGPEVLAGRVYIITTGHSAFIEALNGANHTQIWQKTLENALETLVVTA